jgi:peptide chain release factor 3
MRAKHLGRALEQLAEEGAASVLKPIAGGSFIVGVVGSLQFDVLADRIRTEYDIPVKFEATMLFAARWIDCDDRKTMERFVEENAGSIADDHNGAKVFLARNRWHLDTAIAEWKSIRFSQTREHAD